MKLAIAIIIMASGPTYVAARGLHSHIHHMKMSRMHMPKSHKVKIHKSHRSLLADPIKHQETLG